LHDISDEMGTFLFDKIIFGPVKSRRLGISLGINLLPADRKICSFDCIYCECGRNAGNKISGSKLPERSEVRERLQEILFKMKEKQQLPDVITFAGNGEPTLHPDFPAIIDDTVVIRDLFAPGARIAVLSNATMLHKKEIFEALLKVDDNIQKIDSGLQETIRLVDCPPGNFSLEKAVAQLAGFKGRVIIQTMFIKGTYREGEIDNTTPAEIDSWLKILKKIGPEKVMIYTIDRDTPVESLQKVPLSELHRIADLVKSEGFRVQVSG